MIPAKHMSARASSASFFRVLAFCSVLFFCHRLASFAIMAREFPGLEGTHSIQSFLVGAASDFWTSTLLALVALAFCTILSRTSSLRGFADKMISFSMGMLAILIVAHQGYVEFYRTPVMAFHLRYLLDPEFLAASKTTAWSPLAALNVAGAALAWWISSRPLPQVMNRRPGQAAIAVILVAVVTHALQIRYRVQWFVPGPLQFNALEKIAIDIEKQALIPPPTEGERLRFQQLQSGIAANMEFRDRLRDAFQERIRAGRRPVIAVMALETFRPSETGAYRVAGSPAEQATPELTPEFDRLARDGILFREAWSSGTITCAGQEALWCGQPSGMLTSLMRFRTQVPVSCVPDEVPASGGFPIWIHNGQPRFDNQVSFWKRHGVTRAISAGDFPDETPRGSWGLSDLALAERAAREIAQARLDTGHAFIVPFILTVTNHIPWDLPADAPAHIANLTAPDNQNQKMWRTTAYTDAAIGKFVAASKQLGYWDDMILILAADHGNLEPGKHRTSGRGTMTDDSPARRQSHITLLLSGGLTGTVPRNFHEIVDPVGQTGVAQLIRWITARESTRLTAPDILAWPRNWPVFSDQNEKIVVASPDKLGVENEMTIPRTDLDADLSAGVTGQDSRRDAGIVFKVMTDPVGFMPLAGANHAPLANKPGSRTAD